eukprot:4105264-Alexandrium_andersonii.AAC.1
MCIRDRRLPTGRSGTGAIETAQELGAHPGFGHLRREGDERVLIDTGMKMRLAHVNEESFPGPASAAVNTAP